MAQNSKEVDRLTQIREENLPSMTAKNNLTVADQYGPENIETVFGTVEYKLSLDELPVEKQQRDSNLKPNIYKLGDEYNGPPATKK